MYATVALVALLSGGAQDVGAAWTAWRNGDIDKAHEIVHDVKESQSRQHLMFLIDFVLGKYEDTLLHYNSIRPEYPRFKELDEPVMHAYWHLGMEKAAHEFAKMRGLTGDLLASAETRAERPVSVVLDKVTTIPFADHLLTQYFPAFSTEVNGQQTLAHIDTGGTFLIMGPAKAKSFGIETVDAGKGYHGTKLVPLEVGIANSFKIGDAVLKNVPVAVMPTFTGAQDFVIFGTNVISKFLTTIDYEKKQMTLSLRGDEQQAEAHIKILSEGTTEVPFYMWADHYMFVRGGFGNEKGLNFFVDSGLVSITQEDDGSWRQACFTATESHFKKWGVGAESANKEFFESELPITIGPLVQTRQYFTVINDPSWTNFGGVRIDGLISHAFFNKYTWTIDFDRRVYLFGKQ